MLDPNFVNRFYPWLNDITDGEFKGWIERGLKPNAPEDAKKAYAEFLALEEDARKNYRRL